MAEKRGLFIVFEGIDGCGKSTQLWQLAQNIERRDKYLDIVRTHEPWNNKEIKRRLKEDKDAYSGALEMARLFVDESRVPHTQQLIRPRLEEGYMVLCDRYSMSTCAYQWAQGASLDELISMHRYNVILTPDITFLVDVPVSVCIERRKKRGDPPEKFDSPDFAERLRETYLSLAEKAKKGFDHWLFGNVEVINGNHSIGDVACIINESFQQLYNKWKNSYLPNLPAF